MKEIPDDYEPSWRTCSITFLASIPLVGVGMYLEHNISYLFIAVGVLISQTTVFLPCLSGLYDKGPNIIKEKWEGSRSFFASSVFWIIVCIFVSLTMSGYEFGIEIGALVFVSLLSSLVLFASS